MIFEPSLIPIWSPLNDKPLLNPRPMAVVTQEEGNPSWFGLRLYDGRWVGSWEHEDQANTELLRQQQTWDEYWLPMLAALPAGPEREQAVICALTLVKASR